METAIQLIVYSVEKNTGCKRWIKITIEELKAEASKLGYSLIKKKPYIPIKPCPVCGKKGTSVWHGKDGTQRRCSFCDFRGDWTNNKKISVNKVWNNAVNSYNDRKGVHS